MRTTEYKLALIKIEITAIEVPHNQSLPNRGSLLIVLLCLGGHQMCIYHQGHHDRHNEDLDWTPAKKRQLKQGCKVSHSNTQRDSYQYGNEGWANFSSFQLLPSPIDGWRGSGTIIICTGLLLAPKKGLLLYAGSCLSTLERRTT